MSAQDKKIVSFIAEGCQNLEIAEKLCLSEPTIKAHLSRVYQTLNVKNRAQLACLGRDCDIEGS